MKSEKVKRERTEKKGKKQGAGKEKIAAVIAAVVIVVFLGGSVFIGLLGSGIAGGEKSRVSEKELEKARLSSESGEETDVQVLAMDKDIVISRSETAAPTADSTADAAASGGDYIFPNSDKEYLTDADVSGLSKEQLRIARNEIMARHGRIFDSQDLKDYFGSKSWYNGTISPSEFDANLSSRLSAVEIANIDMIKKYE